MPFKKIITQDSDLNKIQQNAEDEFRKLKNNPLLDSVLVSRVKLEAGKDNLVPHTLGKVPRIWLLAGLNWSSYIWSAASTQLNNQNADERYINILTSTTCTVNLIFA